MHQRVGPDQISLIVMVTDEMGIVLRLVLDHACPDIALSNMPVAHAFVRHKLAKSRSCYDQPISGVPHRDVVFTLRILLQQERSGCV
jgi:hypothetical protein